MIIFESLYGFWVIMVVILFVKDRGSFYVIVVLLLGIGFCAENVYAYVYMAMMCSGFLTGFFYCVASGAESVYEKEFEA